jgi:hypothetical protein
MSERSPVATEVTRDWADGVQDRWESNDRKFTTAELDAIQAAARSLPVDGTGVAGLSELDYRLRRTGELLRMLDDDVEAGWELVIRVLHA